MSYERFLRVDFNHGQWLVLEMSPGKDVTPDRYDAEVRQLMETLEDVLSWTWISSEEHRAWTLSGVLTTWPTVYMAWQTGTCIPLYGGCN